MNTKLTDAENEVETRLTRALWAACLGSEGMAALQSDVRRAVEAIAKAKGE